VCDLVQEVSWMFHKCQNYVYWFVLP
jgi:hypothetical protein